MAKVKRSKSIKIVFKVYEKINLLIIQQHLKKEDEDEKYLKKSQNGNEEYLMILNPLTWKIPQK